TSVCMTQETGSLCWMRTMMAPPSPSACHSVHRTLPGTHTHTHTHTHTPHQHTHTLPHTHIHTHIHTPPPAPPPPTNGMGLKMEKTNADNLTPHRVDLQII